MRYSTAGMAFLLLLVLTAAACSPVMTIGLGDGVRGSGNMITETRDVSDFSGVQLMTSGNATITVGEANSLTIEAEDNIMPLLTSEVRSGVLELGTASNTSISTSRGWQYTITVESLDLLEITGSGDATVNGTVDSNLRVQIAGSGDATLSAVDSADLQVEISGSGDVDASGSATDLTVRIAGSGSFHGFDLTSEDAAATVTGSGRVEVHATGNLSATVAGSGDITYDGSPSVSESVTGSGDVQAR
jgi:hypothetical protein